MNPSENRCSVRSVPSRRRLLRGLAGAGLGWGTTRLPAGAAARRKKNKRKRGLCRKDGSACRRLGASCRKRYCLSAPFTVAAAWAQAADHDTFLFVPPENGETGPGPFIDYSCNPGSSDCEGAYPFACVDGDVTTAGDEVTTVSKLLPGKYEYWVELANATPAGAVTVVLTDNDDRVVRRWTNPANPSAGQAGWHVFDFDGRDGRVASIDALTAESLPAGAHDPNGEVCPD